MLDVAPETADYYFRLALLNLAGLPADIGYGVVLNTAENGDTEAYAKNGTV